MKMQAESKLQAANERLRKQSEACQHIARIRSERFGIGKPQGQENPLAATLHKTVTLLSEALYQKESHFILELIQNAEDNTYPENHSRYMNFFLMRGDPLVNESSRETGNWETDNDAADYTLVVINNEVGFLSQHVDALCSAGSSTKKSSLKGSNYIGEMGIGFKSVFMVSRRPCIISNGYCFRFDEEPDADINLGYIVPYWIEKLNLSFRKKLKSLEDNTCILLPLKKGRFNYVQRQLEEILPETILFLQKLDKLLVCDQTGLKQQPEDNAMAVTREILGNGIIRLRSRKKSEVYYFLFKGEFPVFENVLEEKRHGVKTWTITLAFPLDGLPNASHSIFSFLPTEVESGWPFLVNADFVLVASRETFHVNRSWNQGILACMVETFVHGYLALQASEDALSRLPSKYSILSFIPTFSHFAALEPFRQDMVKKLSSLEVVPVSSIYHSKQSPVITDQTGAVSGESCKMQFCSADKARFVDKQFLEIVYEAKAEGLSLPGPLAYVSNIYVVDDIVKEKHYEQLRCLGVGHLNIQEYAACVLDREWCLRLSDRLYVKLLRFLMQGFTADQQIIYLEKPFVRVYREDMSIDLSCCTLKYPVYFPQSDSEKWLFEQVHSLQHLAPIQILPESIYQLIRAEADGKQLLNWLQHTVHVNELTVQSYAQQLLQAIQSNNDIKSVFKVTEFLRLALDKKLLSLGEAVDLKSLPIVSETKLVIHRKPKNLKKTLLLPRSGSEWPLLLDDADPRNKLFIKLSPLYMENWLPNVSVKGFAWQQHLHNVQPSVEDWQARIAFLRHHFGAKDLLDIDPHPTWALLAVEKGLSSKQASLLIKWIAKLCACKSEATGPRGHTNSATECTQLQSSVFMKTLKANAWLPTTHGYKKPEQTFIRTPALDAAFGDLLPYIAPEAIPDEKELFVALQFLGLKQEVSVGNILEILKKSFSEPATKTNLVTVERLFKYLQNNIHEHQTEFLFLIWVPKGVCNHSDASWLVPSDCIWDDPSSLFQGKHAILSRIYDRSLEGWFKRLGVVLEPGVDLYLNKWLEICQTSLTTEKLVSEVSQVVAEKIWSKIALHVDAVRQQKGKLENSNHNIKLPTTLISSLTMMLNGDDHEAEKEDQSSTFKERCQEDNPTLLLKSANEVFISDDLYLEKVFTDKYPALPLAWQPPSLGSKEIQSLHLLYKELGALSLSEATRMCMIEPVSLSSSSLYHDVDLVPFLAKPLFLVIMGFLSSSLTGGSQYQDRREILLPLMQSEELNVPKIEVNYQLYGCSESNQPKLMVEVYGSKAAYWNREKKVLYRTSHLPKAANQGWACRNVDAAVDLARSLSSVLPCSNGLELVQKFEEFLLPFAMQEFCITSVLQLLRSKNIRILACDEQFIDDFLTAKCPDNRTIGTNEIITKKKRKILHDMLDAKEEYGALSKQRKSLKAIDAAAITDKSATLTEAQFPISKNGNKSGNENRIQDLQKMENGLLSAECWEYLNKLGIYPSVDLSSWMTQLKSIFSGRAGNITLAARLSPDKLSCLEWWIKDCLPLVKSTLGFLGSTNVPEYLDHLLLLAFLHPSYFGSRQASYERLEYLGDAWLGAIIATRLFLLHPEADEGSLSKMRSMLVCNNTNNLYLRAVDLDRFIIMGKGDLVEDEEQNLALVPREWNRRHGVPNKVAADVVESILAAILFAYGSQGPAEADRVLFEIFIRGLLTSPI
ncbi:hypothetical protein O6H91_05G003500 [Diphasiastrum complanatum]|uniref:Uncharacterized protein n=1 Tax=Diphasiastrum complanatum TaxID=34168 RepID=A0ACC2DL06_DIPCM|nr:hypothetical protein O6H91_05G003500 [Diphasiastrum complanatum]